MIDELPFYIVITFIITTLLTVGIFQSAIKRGAFSSKTTSFINFILPFWLIFQATLGYAGFYKKTESIPPRLIIFGVLPCLIFIAGLFIFSRDWINKLPLKNLTLIHLVRLPVEIVLFWLYQNAKIPQIMTFEGRNWDILMGISAPIVFWLAFRDEQPKRTLLFIWNIIGLGLLINVVAHAILSFPSPLQQISFEQPNVAVMYFPFVWLPSVVVPIVLFSHLAAIFQIFQKKT